MIVNTCKIQQLEGGFKRQITRWMVEGPREVVKQVKGSALGGQRRLPMELSMVV